MPQAPHVSASGFEGVPKPAAMPPIMIGGGSPKVLGIAGREADIVSLNFDNSSGKLGAAALGSGSDDQTAKKIEWIKAGAGDRFDDIELEIGGYFTVVTDHGEATAAAIAGRFGAPPEAFANHTHALIGSVDEIVDKLEERRDRFGITFTTIGVGSMHDFAPVFGTPLLMRQLVVVSGAPGAGKSTLAEPLAKALGFPLLSKDVIKETIFDSIGDFRSDLVATSGRHRRRGRCRCFGVLAEDAPAGRLGGKLQGWGHPDREHPEVERSPRRGVLPLTA